MNESLRTFIKDIKNLPTIPVIAQEVLNLLNDNMLSVERLENIVEKDPAISAKILSVANSAFFGFQVTTDALGNAMMRIGFNNVKNIALGISLMTILDDGKRGRAFDYQKIFNHSVAVGFTARLLSRNMKLESDGESLMVGMLHDLGYLVLNRYFPDKYEEVLSAFQVDKNLLDAEKKVLDFTHADVGMWLAEEWKLPDVVKDANLFHHTPALAKRNEKHVAMIHIADYLTTKNIMSPTEKDPNYPLDPASLEILGISEDHLKDLEESLGGVPFSDEIFK
jgi:putative nucleotidyltransferase with HDIG domain